MFWFSFSRPRKVMWGLFWVLLGLFLLLSNHGLLGYSFAFSRDWPILLIAWGLMKIIDLVAWRDGRSPHKFKIIREECCGGDGARKPGDGPAENERAEIIKAVEEGRMSADEAAERLKNL
jgi:hypothetical protein